MRSPDRARKLLTIFRAMIGYSLLVAAYLLVHLQSLDLTTEKVLQADIFRLLSMGWVLALVLTHQYGRPLNWSFKELANPYLKGYVIILSIGLAGPGDPTSTLRLVCTFILAETAFNLAIWAVGNRGRRASGAIPDIDALLKDRQQARLPVPELNPAFNDLPICELITRIEAGDNEQLHELSSPDAKPKGGIIPKVGIIDNEGEVATTGRELGWLLSKPPLNSLRRVNRHLGAAFATLVEGGFAIFVYEPLEKRRERTRAPRLDFLIHRALPRLPVTEWVYPLITGGRNRAMSRAEVWGRLQYSGYDVLREEEAESGECLVLARKLYEPSKVTNPSHYPVIKLDRMGLGGEIIKIHKVRTMHPYSEFIQQKLFDMYDLSATGKFKEDFRITGWGKVLRRYWLDELPQLLDWLRGNIKIVGIRAMSLHYFSLYPRRYQDKYCQVKPGFLSPIFDESTSSFDDIVATEERYLDAYLEKPLRADLRYFRSTLSDIMFKGTRSG